MGSQIRWMVLVCCVTVAGLTGLCARAFGFDGPVVRMARLSYVAGAVTVGRADNTGQDPAQLNMPLPEGMRVVTAGDGQAEIEFEDGSLLRVTPNSAVTLTSLGVDGSGNYLTRVDMLHGLMYAEVRAATRFQYLIEAGGDAISPVTNATVRIQFDQPPASVAVLDGAVHVANGVDQGGAGFQTELRAGESLRNDASDPSRYLLSQTVEKESWDSWNESRDQAAANEAEARTTARSAYAGDQGYGWSDLDANGSWYDVPGQGQVWQPSLAASGAGFDPYGYGSWVWYPASGYVWSSGYSWGWTPYRCGSWSYFNSFGWGWAPGSTCGVGGWRFGRGGYPINIAQGPPSYHRPRPPVPGPVKVHPLVVVNLGGLHDGSISPGRIHDGSLGSGLVNGTQNGLRTNGPRTIAGQTVWPLRPIGSGYTQRGGGAVGSTGWRSVNPGHRGSGQSAGTPAAGSDLRHDLPQPGGAAAGQAAPMPPVMRQPPAGMSWPTTRPAPGASTPVRPGPPEGQVRRIPPVGPAPGTPPAGARPMQPPAMRPMPPAPAMRPMPAPAMRPMQPAPAPRSSTPAPAPAAHR